MDDPVAGFLSAVMAFFIASSAAMLLSVRRRAWTGRVLGWKLARRASVCGVCGYSLAGLGGGARCPECGWPSLIPAPTTRLVVNPVVVRRWWLVLLVNIATLFVLESGARWGLVRAYVRDGFDVERATRWVPMRELSRYSGVYVSSIQLMWPLLAVTAVVFPLCVLLPWRRWWVVMLVLWPLAYAGALWRVAAFC